MLGYSCLLAKWFHGLRIKRKIQLIPLLLSRIKTRFKFFYLDVIVKNVYTDDNDILYIKVSCITAALYISITQIIQTARKGLSF